MTPRLIPILLALLTVPGLVRAQQAAIPVAPQLRVYIEPSHILRGGAHVQGQVRVRVQLTSPHPFAAINFTMPAIEDAQVVELFPPKTRTIHVYEKTGYAYETHLALFPGKSGTLIIPQIAISGAISLPDGTSEPFELVHDPIEIPVYAVDPALESSWWMVSDSVEISEQWDPAPELFRDGETIRRHVSIVAHGVVVAQLPVIEQRANQGYAVVGAQQQTKTDITTEGLVARVKQTWELRIQTSDVLYVSPIEIHYWDPATDRPAVARLPSKRIEPLVRDPEAIRQGLIEEAMLAHRGHRAGAMILLGFPAAALLGFLALVGFAAKRTHADRRLLADCRTDVSPEATLAAVARWSQTSFGQGGSQYLGGVRTRLSGEAVDLLAEAEAAVFGIGKPSIAARRLTQALVRAARRARMATTRHRLMAMLSLFG